MPASSAAAGGGTLHRVATNQSLGAASTALGSSALSADLGHATLASPQSQRQAAPGDAAGGRSGGGAGAAPARDVGAELTAVVAWCQRQMVWEKLTSQLTVRGLGGCMGGHGVAARSPRH